jgi:glycosyltransferase involved in cell wall biosynthesis
MSPKVSILLPTHNKADLLSFAIRSILKQTHQDFEALIVGDGCTDHTAQVVKGFDDPRLIWFDLPKAPNYGYANRNIALRQARGELVAFMAHDDLWMSDHLERLIPFFGDPRVEIAYSRPLWVIPKGKIAPGFFNIEHPGTLDLFLEVGNRIPAACVLHRRECFLKYGYWNDQLPVRADWDMWKRIIKGGNRTNFAYSDTPTCLHFKADWHDPSYDQGNWFPEWVKLFDAGRMPRALKVRVAKETTEQEAVWRAMAPNPQEWNASIRSAVRQVTDLLAQEGLARSATFQGLIPVRTFLNWKLHEEILRIPWTRRLYTAFKNLIKSVSK